MGVWPLESWFIMQNKDQEAALLLIFFFFYKYNFSFYNRQIRKLKKAEILPVLPVCSPNLETLYHLQCTTIHVEAFPQSYRYGKYLSFAT